MNIVIGGGLSGLLTGYLTGATVITDSVGGQLSYSFPLGPRILHKTPDTEYLLKDLGVKAEPRIFRIGYLEDGGVYSTPPPGFRERYYKKTRGVPNPSPSSMSDGQNTIIGWDLNEISLIDTLSRRVAHFRGRVLRVVDLVKELVVVDQIEKPRFLNYDKVYSTLPLSTTYRLINLICPYHMVSTGTYFLNMPLRELGELASYAPHYDYIYAAGPEPYHRITFRWPLDEATIEIGSTNYPGGYLALFPRVYVPDCQLINRVGITSIPKTDIQLVGRYAEWDHGVRAHDIVGRFVHGNKQVGEKRD